MSIPCAAVGGCTNPAAFQWQRRPTDAELAPIVAAEVQWREEISALYPDYAQPDFGPLPDATNTTVPVYACQIHEIDLDLACHVHQSVCTAPNPANLPGCDCTPEPLPPENAPQVVVANTLLRAA